MSPEPSFPDASSRREALLRDMRERAEAGQHCSACSGVCCTYVANSMKITPVEARDLKTWLEQQGRWTPELLESLRTAIQRYRLDHDVGDGRRSLRRTYTCPFYQPGSKGCSISRHHKPYGCLAFNPRAPGLSEGGHCASDQNLLRQREQLSPEEGRENRRLKSEWGWTEDTLPIPLALISIVPKRSAHA